MKPFSGLATWAGENPLALFSILFVYLLVALVYLTAVEWDANPPSFDGWFSSENATPTPTVVCGTITPEGVCVNRNGKLAFNSSQALSSGGTLGVR